MMVSSASVEEDPEYIEVHVSDEIRLAAETAAMTEAKSVSELLKEILERYLTRSGYL